MNLLRVLSLLICLLPLKLLAQDAEARDNVLHYDVKKMRSIIKEKHLSFEVKDSWVTEFLLEGGREKDITGLERPRNWRRSASGVQIKVADELPAAFDWRDKVEGGLQPIRNQGNCGSCWAFSVVGVVESLLKIKDPKSQPDLAEQTLVSSCSNAGSCSGGSFDAFDYIQNPGLPDEAQDPYKAYNTRCKKGLKAVAAIKEWHYIKNGNSFNATIDQMKTAMLQYGPLSVTVNASFGSYSSGIYDYCNNGGVNHMVDLVGWNDDGEYWIMRNSWGTSWGEEGYMKIKYKSKRGYKCNNIGQESTFAILADAPPEVK